MTTLLGNFNPAVETYPTTAGAYPTSTNIITADSSGELALTPTSMDNADLARSTDFAYAGGGIYSTKVTVDYSNVGPAVGGVNAKMACPIPNDGATRYISMAVYVPAASTLIGKGCKIGYGLNSTPTTITYLGASPFTLAAGWNYFSSGISGVAADFVAFGRGLPASFVNTDFFYIDQWDVSTTNVWQPVSGEPFYNAGQTWYCTGAGTFQGHSIAAGDILTCTVGTFSYYTAATWSVTSVPGDIETALQQRPTDDVGHPTGFADWRLGVQILLPSDGSSLFDVAVFDTATFTFLQWFDITEYVRGMTWTRGADEFGGRPRVGVATVTLENQDYVFSPIDPTNSFNNTVNAFGSNIVNNYFTPGTIMRIVAHSPLGYIASGTGGTDDTWVPQITGVVESWPETRTNLDEESYVNVTFTETLSWLARVDDNALAAVVGDGETAYQRVQRLANAAEWPFGFIDDSNAAFDSYPLQSTLMASNRLAEIYLTADSVGGIVCTDRTGALRLVYLYSGLLDRGPLPNPDFMDYDLTGLPQESLPWVVYIDPEGLVVDNDTAPIINVAQYARVGGTVQTATDALSQTRFGRISTGRSDLINKSDVLTLALAQSVVDVRGHLTKRLHSVKVDGQIDPRAIATLITIDVPNRSTSDVFFTTMNGDVIQFESPDISAMTHNVTPLNAQQWRWTCEYAFGSSSTFQYSTVPPDDGIDPNGYLWPWRVTDSRVGYARVGSGKAG